jgi:hypothetical protein
MKKLIKFLNVLTHIFFVCIFVFIVGCQNDENSLQVKILPVGSGTVGLSPSGGSYAKTTVVTLLPKPSTDCVFSSWGGKDSSFVKDNAIIMSKDMEIIAKFELKASIRMKSGTGLNDGAHIYFLALSKDSFSDHSIDALFGYRKTDADWYIDGDVIPFVTDYKEFNISSGKYFVLVSAAGIVMTTSVTVLPGKQTYVISGTTYALEIKVLQP